MSTIATNIVVRFIGETSSLQSAFLRTSALSRNMTTGVGRLSSAIAGYSQALTTHGRRMTAGVSLPLAALTGVAVKAAVTYEDSVSRMSRLADASASDAQRWSKQIISLSEKVPIGPNKLAEALYQVASSGVPVKKVFGIIENAAKGTAAGLGEVDQVARLAVTTTNVYGAANLSAAKSLDIVTEAVRLGSGETAEFARTLGRVTPVANLLDVKFNDVGAAMAVLTNRGMSVAESGTGVRQMFMNLLKPSKKARELVEEAGTSFEGIRKIFAEKGLLAGMGELQRLSGGNNEKLATLLPNVRGLNAYLSIMSKGTMPETLKIFGDMRDSTGELDTAFEKASRTSKFKLEKVLSSLEASAIRLGTIALPYVASAADWMSRQFKRFGELSPKVQKIIMGVAAFLIVLGPAMYILGQVGMLLSFLVSPIGLVIAGLVGLAVGAKYLYDHWAPFHDFVANKLIPTMKNFGGEVVERVSKGIGLLKDAWSSRGDNTGGADGWRKQTLKAVGAVASGLDTAKVEIPKKIGQIRAAWSNRDAGEQQGGVFSIVLDVVASLAQTFDWASREIPKRVSQIKEAWSARGGDGKEEGAFGIILQVIGFLARAFDWASANIPGILATIGDAFSKAISWIVENLQKLWTWVKNYIMPVFSSFYDMIVPLIKIVAVVIGLAMIGIIKSLSWFWDYFGPTIKAVMKGIWEVIQAVWGAIKAVIEGTLKVISGIFTFFAGVFRGDWSRMWNGIKQIFSGVWHALAGIVSGAWNLLFGVVRAGIKTVVGILGGMGRATRDAVSGAFDAVKSGFKSAINWIIDKWNGLKFTLPELNLGPLGKVGGWTIGVPQIPKLAKGAVVKSPTLALIGEAGTEVVFPVNDPRRGMSLLQEAGVLGRSEVGAASGQPSVVIQYSPTFTLMDASEASRINEREMSWLMKTNGR